MTDTPRKESPWGPLEVTDAHLHFFSRGFFTLLARQAGLDGAGQACARAGVDVPPAAARDFATQWAAELDRHGVARAVLLASLPGDEPSVAEAVAAFPQRFFGWFFVNPLMPHAAARVEDVVAAAGVSHGTFYTYFSNKADALDALIDPISVLNRSNWGQLHECDGQVQHSVTLPGGASVSATAGGQFVLRLPQLAHEKATVSPRFRVRTPDRTDGRSRLTLDQ